MSLNFSILNNVNTEALEKVLVTHINEVPVQRVVEYEQLKPFSQEEISIMCHKYGFYQIVTQELVDFIRPLIADKAAIEIGSGNGCLGRALEIPLTDSLMQTRPEIMAYYQTLGQPLIKYPDDLVKVSGNEAIEKYKPEIVIGAWVTQLDTTFNDGNPWGINELFFKRKIKQYILVGNEGVHNGKKILKTFPFKKHKFEWLISRSMKRDKNCIYVIDCE